MQVNFFIVGAPKSGTTSLYNYLNQHHSISMSSIKEPNYFSSSEIIEQKLYYKTKPVSDLKKYHELFDFNNDSCLYGEASVSYLYYSDVASKICYYNEKAKIIVILRDPVERAISHYNMDKRLGFVKENLSSILDNASLKNHILYYQQYIQLGFYYSQVKKYIDVFGKENVCVMLYDDLKKDNVKFTNEILDFLQLDADTNIDYETPYNSNKVSENKLINYLYSISFIRRLVVSMFPNSILKKINKSLFSIKETNISQELEMKLFELFKEDILLLEQMLNIDLNSWKR